METNTRGALQRGVGNMGGEGGRAADEVRGPLKAFICNARNTAACYHSKHWIFHYCIRKYVITEFTQVGSLRIPML